MARLSTQNGFVQPHGIIAAQVGLCALLATPFAFAQRASPAKGPPPVILTQPAPATGTSATVAVPPRGSSPTRGATAVTTTSELPNLPMEAETDITDTREDPDRKYYFVGLRYRGTIIPQFFENIFVNDGATVYSNSLGIEVDIRKGGSSLIPWLQYTDYNTGDIMFLQKGQPDLAANRSVVNSSLKAVFLGVDELWSVPIVPTKLDFEIGFGVGIGGVFGTLMNNWVYLDDTRNAAGMPNGQYASSNGHRYSKCLNTGTVPPNGDTTLASNGCAPGNHKSQDPAKTNGYVEPNWFNGGSVPVVFPHISVPQLGLRYKPIKNLEVRGDVGFGLTGFWWGLSLDYGLEKTGSADAHKSGLRTGARDTI